MFLSASSGCALAETFNDCILENMKGIGSHAAAVMVRKACRDKVLPYVPAKCQKKLWKEPAEVTQGGNFFDQFDKVAPKGMNRLYDDPTSKATIPVDITIDECVTVCLNASYWSKTFGDCKR